MIYNLVFAAIVATWLVFNRSSNAKLPVLAWCIALFFFIGFRFEVGCDWTGYLNQYDATQGASFQEAREVVEPAYALMFMAIHSADLDYPWINVLSALVFVIGLYVFCRRQPDPMAALALFFPIVVIQLAMSGIRQASALAIMMWAFMAFVDRRRVLYCVLVVAASLFHRSAIVFLLYAVFIGRQPSLLLVAVLSLAAAAGTSLVGSLGFEDYQSRYIDTTRAANGALPRVGLVAVAAALFLWNARRWRSASPADYGWLAAMSGAMVACIPLAIAFPVVGDRFGYYLVPAQVAIFGRLPFIRDQRSRNGLLTALPFVLLGGFQVLWFQFSDLAQVCYVPYRTWLFDWAS